MIRSLNTGVLGIKQFQTSLDAIGNNLANINTIGFKGARVDFSDTLAQTLRAPTPDGATTSGQAGMQVGNGVTVSAIKNQFTQGAIKQTGVRTDMAITGEGFFMVKDATTNELFVTRAGDFREDKNGMLVTNDGYRVQGLNKQAPANTTAEQMEIGDIKLDVGKYTEDRTGLTIGAHDRMYKESHGYTTGNQVKFSGGLPALVSGSTPLSNSTPYFVAKVDANYFTLHATAADAASGANAINFSNATTGISISGSTISSVSVPVKITNATGNGTTVAQQTGISFSNGSTSISKNSHGYTSGQAVRFKTAAPGGASLNTTYYVGGVAANTFTLHATQSDATTGSGTNPITFTSTANHILDSGKTFTKANHGYTTGTSVKFNTSAPAGFDTTSVYFVRSVDANNYTLHSTPENATANTNALSYAQTDTYGLDSGVALIKSGHGLGTGDTVRFNTTAPGGAAITTTYYVKNLSASSFSLHASSADATNGVGQQSFSSGGSFNLDKGSVLSKAGHGLTTGEPVNFTGTVPGNTTTAGTYYARAVDANSLTLHSSVTDANSGANPIVFNTTGTDYSVDGSATGTYSLVGGASISSYSVGADGKVNMLLTDGTQYSRAQLLLQNFQNPQALLKQGANLYGNLATAGPAGITTTSAGATEILTNAKAPGASGMGRIAAGSLELSNVDMAREFSSMITTQRAFQANARVISTSDEILKEMMALKR